MKSTAAAFTRSILAEKEYQLIYGNPNSRAWKEDAQAKMMDLRDALGDKWDAYVDNLPDTPMTWKAIYEQTVKKLQEIKEQYHV